MPPIPRMESAASTTSTSPPPRGPVSGAQGRVGVVEVGLHALGAGLLFAEQPAEGEAVAALAGSGRAPARAAAPGE